MVKIALLQLSSCGCEQQANLEKGLIWCRKAKELGADIALFPEMWNIGYTFYDSNKKAKISEWKNNAIDLKSDFISKYQTLAQELNMAIAITYLEKWQPYPRNTVSLINRFGKIVLTYGKVHTCDFAAEIFCTPGEEFFVCDLDTEKGRIKIGCMICFDREFPESVRILMLQGAEIILVPNACELEQNRIAQIKTRAFENMVGMAVANYPVPQANGHSIACDGMAFDKNGSRNHLLLEAPKTEGIFIAEFDLDALRSYRKNEVWGDAYRKPNCYKLLCANNPAEVFTRKDARR